MTYQICSAAIGSGAIETGGTEGTHSQVDGITAQKPVVHLLKVRRHMRARAQRGDVFGANLFSDPAWDMLLELYAAFLIERRLSVSRLTERSGLAMTTALRWMGALEKEGLMVRLENPTDRRQVMLTLSEKGCAAMAAYFSLLEDEVQG